MMPHPRRDRARSGWGTGLDSRRAIRSAGTSSRPGRSSRRIRVPGRATPIDSILAEFTSRWERGEAPSIEEYLARLGPAPTSDAAVLIYHAFCLAEAAGPEPRSRRLISNGSRQQGPSLERLFGLHRAFDTVAAPALGRPGDVARGRRRDRPVPCCSASWARADSPGCSWPSSRTSTTASWS